MGRGRFSGGRTSLVEGEHEQVERAEAAEESEDSEGPHGPQQRKRLQLLHPQRQARHQNHCRGGAESRWLRDSWVGGEVGGGLVGTRTRTACALAGLKATAANVKIASGGTARVGKCIGTRTAAQPPAVCNLAATTSVSKRRLRTQMSPLAPALG